MDAIDRLRRGYEQFNSVEPFDPDDFTDDFVLEQTRVIPDTAGRFEGVAGLARARAELLDGFEMVRFDPLEYERHGDHVVVPVTVTTSTRGVEQTAKVFHLWRVADGNRLARCDVHASRTDALAAIPS